MAQINFTLNQEEIQELFEKNSSDAFKELFASCLNSILQAEAKQKIGAGPYERSETRTDIRNGSRERELNTRIGTITLNIPRYRNQPFKTMLFENYSRSEAALVAAMAEMVVNGVSTRKVTRVMEELCGTSFSKSTVSDACKELDAKVREFKERPLCEKYLGLMVDAIFLKVRENHRIVTKALMVAVALQENGRREIIGLELFDNESKETWREFLSSLKKRGLKEAKIVISDAHNGIMYAVGKVFPTSPWQRCQTHFSANILDKAPKMYQKAIHAMLTEMYNCKTLDEAERKRDEIAEEYRDVASDAIDCLEEGFDDAMTVMALPPKTRKLLRTNNHLERLNREIRRRTDVIGVFPTDSSIIRLVGSYLIEQNDLLMAQHPALMSKDEIKSLPDCEQKLKSIALEQQRKYAA